jgi:hypothetical protein
MRLFAATDEVIVDAGMSAGGPPSIAFVRIVDRATGEVLAHCARPGAVGPLASVGSRPLAGHRSRFRSPGTELTIDGDGRELRVRALLHHIPHIPFLSKAWLDLDLRMAVNVQEGATAVSTAPGHNLVAATAANAGLPTRGRLSVKRDGRELGFGLTGSGGFEYADGSHPRHSMRTWALAAGEDLAGRSLGFTLTAGPQGSGNVAWLGRGIARLPAEVSFEPPAEGPLGEWSLHSPEGGVDLRFDSVAVHTEDVDLVVAHSRFAQPTGHFSGRIEVDGEPVSVDRVPGFIEARDVLW